MPTLFEISDDLVALETLLDETGGDVSDPAVAAAVDAWFAEIQTNMTAKVDNYCAFIRELEARASVRKEESERLLKRVRADENAAKSLKGRLQMVFEIRNLGKVETPRFRVSLSGNGSLAPLTVHDEKVIPKSYFYTPPPVLDKDKVRADLEAGKEVPGCTLEPRGKHLNIR